VAHPNAPPPLGRLALHDEHPDQPATIILYDYDSATPVGQITIERDTLLLYAHVFLEAGLRAGAKKWR